MQPKFTPGPWRTNGEEEVVFGDEGMRIAWLVAQRDHRRRANARLIAAAPDLYAAMAELSDLCPRMNDDDPIGPAIHDAIMRGRAALRKADGDA